MKATSALPAPPTTSSNDALLLAFFCAAVVHVMLILGINFKLPAPEKFQQSIDITLVNVPTQKAPEKASFLAPEHQQGGGEKAQKSKPLQKKLPSSGHSGELPAMAKRPPPQPLPTPVKPLKPVLPRQQPAAMEPAKPVLTQQRSEAKISRPVDPVVETPQPPQPATPHAGLTPEALARQIAQLGAEIRSKALSAERTRVKFLNSVSAHRYLAAQYISDWQNKVERTGNMNYPEVARKKGFTGRLTMTVGIKSDGSVSSIEINRRSGYPALDEAAKRIVRMSAPFPPLPQELLKELDVLMISRVWEFSDESGMSSSAR